MRFKDYHKPATIGEVLVLLRRKAPRTIVLSGGTCLNGEAPRDVEAVVDIGELGLNKIELQSSPPLLSVGAAVTLQTLAESLRDTPGLEVIATTAHAMAAINIRNQATLGGAIVTADSASPLVTALIACDADLVIHAAQERTVSLTAFLSYRERLMADGVLITAVRLPIPSPDTHSDYERVARTPSDYPIVCAVAKCATKDGIVGHLRVAVGGVAPTPIRLNALAFALEKKSLLEHLDGALDDAAGRLAPHSDFLGSAEYRTAVARVLVRRAILKAAGAG